MVYFLVPQSFLSLISLAFTFNSHSLSSQPPHSDSEMWALQRHSGSLKSAGLVHSPSPESLEMFWTFSRANLHHECVDKDVYSRSHQPTDTWVYFPFFPLAEGSSLISRLYSALEIKTQIEYWKITRIKSKSCFIWTTKLTSDKRRHGSNAAESWIKLRFMSSHCANATMTPTTRWCRAQNV